MEGRKTKQKNPKPTKMLQSGKPVQMSDCLVRDYRAPIETSSFLFFYFFGSIGLEHARNFVCVCRVTLSPLYFLVFFL
jgi:hypothetical protein